MILRPGSRAASRRHVVPIVVAAVAVITGACGSGEARATDSVAIDTAHDSVPADTIRHVAVPIPAKALPPLADSIAGRLVFVPTTQSWFLAASRKKRLLVDIGRVDDEVTKVPARLAAYKQAVGARSPLREGDRLVLRGPWGTDSARVTGFDVHNGRIVALVAAARRVDSLASADDGLAAVAYRADGAVVPDSACDRTIPDALRSRTALLKDSLEKSLREGPQPAYARLQSSLKVRSSAVGGCFTGGRALVQVALYGGDYEWVRERVVLVSETGAAKPVKVSDFRFRAHELLGALDADGDGADDVAARGYGVRAGGTVVLKLSEGPKLDRVASGFAWER